MSALIIDGKTVAASIHRKTAAEAVELKEKYGITPGLAVVLVGEDPASKVYVGTKVKKCGELGFLSRKIELPENTTQQELLKVVEDLNHDPAIHGILVQSPPPKQINEEEIVLAIDPAKDVDCFHPFNAGKLFLGDTSGFLPCTPAGVMEMLRYYNLSTKGKHAVVLGRSTIVGRPMAALLMNKGADATVTVCHSRTENLREICASADILIAAIGKPRFVTKEMVKPGAAVIDVGINRIPAPETPKGTRLVGDVDFDNVLPLVSAITPVPGGVGPMTIAMLMQNAVRAARRTVR